VVPPLSKRGKFLTKGGLLLITIAGAAHTVDHCALSSCLNLECQNTPRSNGINGDAMPAKSYVIIELGGFGGWGLRDEGYEAENRGGN